MEHRPEPTLPRRLGWMADAVLSAVIGPKSRFFSRERVDEIVLLLREAEKALIGKTGSGDGPPQQIVDELLRRMRSGELGVEQEADGDDPAGAGAVPPPEEPK